MPASETTHEIVVDSSGRITALPDNSPGKSRPLKIGDRISIYRIGKTGYRRYAKKPLLDGKSDVGHSRVGQSLMKHAIDTFGSEEGAQRWLASECGALNNETPAAFIKKTGNAAEVERILGCIDYGMIA